MDEKQDRDLFSVKNRWKPSSSTKKYGKRKRAPEEEEEEEYERDKPKRIVFGDSDEEEEEESKPKKKIFAEEESSSRLETLNYENLMAGLVTLGCISNVSDYSLTISLPFMLIGKVPITRISKAYTHVLKKMTNSTGGSKGAEEEALTLVSLFKKGQYVATKVDSVEKGENGHKVHLSLMPHDVNFGVPATKLQKGMVLQCNVASIEDNGYVMETGISNVQAAFLNRGNTVGTEIAGVGSVVRCAIIKASTSEDGTTVQLKLSALPKDIDKAVLEVSETDDLSLLVPGTAISTTVAKVKKDCLKVLLGEGDGVVSSHHLQTPLDQPTNYEVTKNVKARVLYITPLSRIVHLTLQKSIFTQKQDEGVLHGLELGEAKKGRVLEITGRGIFFKLKQCRAFCTRKHLRDKNSTEDYIKHHFSVGSEHKLRVMSYHYFDETFIVSLQQSVMEDPVIAYNSLKVGQVLQATILRYESNKAIVSLASKIEGEIPFIHLTDTVAQHPQKKYAVGSSVRVRVLQVIPEKRHLVLTCKKLLINCDVIMSEYNKDFEGSITTGFVVKVTPLGILVAFFGDVKGFVLKSNATYENIDNLSARFRVGDIVKCKVMLVKPELQRIFLSLKLYDDDDDDSETAKSVAKVTPSNVKSVVKVTPSNTKTVVKVTPSNAKSVEKDTPKAKKGLNVGLLVSCLVTEIEEDTIQVRIKPGKVKAQLPVSHLSDSKRKCKDLKDMLSQGDQIDNLAVFRKSNGVLLSMKESVCEWILKSKPNHSESFKRLSVYPGAVCEILPSGIMVAVPVGTSGQSVCVSPKLEKVSHFSVGDSIEVKCEDFDQENKPLFSIHTTSENKKHLELHSLFKRLKYQNLLQKYLSRKGLVSQEFSETEIGSNLEVDIVYVTPLGLVVEHCDYGIFGIVPEVHLQAGVDYKIGQKIIAVVLHIDLKERCILFSARLNLIGQLHLHKVSNVTVGEKIKCEVLLKQQHFTLVMANSQYRGLVAYIPPKKKVTVGQKINVIVKHVEKKMVLGASELQNKVNHYPVLSPMPTIHLQLQKPNSGEVFAKSFGVINEEDALEKIKRIFFIREQKKKQEDVTGTKVSSKVEQKNNRLVKKEKDVVIKENDTSAKTGKDKTVTDGNELREKKSKKKKVTGGKDSGEESDTKKKVTDGKNSSEKEKEMDTDDSSAKPSKKKKVTNADSSEKTSKKKKVTDAKDSSEKPSIKKKVTDAEDSSKKTSKKKKVTDAEDSSEKPSKKKKVTNAEDSSEKPSKKKKVTNAEDSNKTSKKKKVTNAEDSSEKPSKKKKAAVEIDSIEETNKDIFENITQKIGIDERDESDSGVDENMDTELLPKTFEGTKACLKINSGFVWDVPEVEDKEINSSDSDDEEEELKKKKRKKLTRAEQELLAKEEERRLFELESSRLEKERLPQSALDYEELLQESPNSSAVWIQFVSFHLENAEVEQAKSVAQRALKMIDVQEFEERINIWTVVLRLEVLYGTDESVNASFNEALATNDPFKIYSAMAMVYAENGKLKEAEDIYFKMTKKFSQNLEAWVKAGVFFFKNSKLEEGRKYMDRALLSLHKSDHVNLINRFAQLEFKLGELERGRTMFESLLGNYPKRMDMWLVYVDSLVKRGDIEGARQVLERMTSLKVKLRQMRLIFKKFLEFEKVHGTPQSVESIKTRVQEYVAAALQD